MDKFYVVIGESVNSTSFKHSTYEAAEMEAEKLCKKENEPFYVLETISMCERVHAPVKWTKKNGTAIDNLKTPI